MELSWAGLTVWWDHIPFNDFIEWDTGGKIVVTATRAEWFSITRYDHGWVYKDYGAGYWDLPLTFNFTMKITDNNEPYHPIVNFALRNSTSEWVHPNAPSENWAVNVITQIWYTNNQPKVQFWIPGLALVEYQAANGDFLAYCILTINSTDAELTMYQADWSTKYARLNIDITGTQTAKGNWRYLYVHMNKWYGSGSSRPIWGYTEYLYVENSTIGYDPDGLFYTTEVLSSFNGSTIVLLTNASLNTGDIEVQFSPNNITWRDHENVLASHDHLVSGNESIDLRDCNYTALYMRFNFTRGANPGFTPRLFQIRVITTDSPPCPPSLPGGIGFVVGGFILIPVALLLVAVVFRRKR